MAALAVGPQVLNPAHVEMQQRLGRAVVESMQEIVRGSEEAIARQDHTKGAWYPGQFISTFEKTQPREVERLREGGHLLHGWMPEQYFRRLKIQGDQRSWIFVAKDDVLPSDAIKAAKVGLSIIACGTACHLARYDALLKILGEEKFNRLFSKAQGGEPINLDFEQDFPEKQPIEYFVQFTQPATKAIERQDKRLIDHRVVEVGQVVAFLGVPDYAKKHLRGMGARYNVVCLEAKGGAQRYIGHGTPSTGYTEVELARLMIENYNAESSDVSRMPTARQVEEGKIQQQAKRVDALSTRKQPFAKVNGFDPTSPQEFRADLIFELSRMTAARVTMDFVRKYVEGHPARGSLPVMTTSGMSLMDVLKLATGGKLPPTS